MIKTDDEQFPLSKKKHLKGNRHIMREKIIQILTSHEISGTPWTSLFGHIFFREFNFGDEEEKSEKLLTQEEIIELEADIPILWEQKDIDFAQMILQSAIDLKKDVDEKLEAIVANWEIERITLIDKIIIYLAAAELVSGHEIPIRVTLNEAIELGKSYSTSKSGTFINGVIDQLVAKFQKENRINKTGKGLK